MYIHTDIFQYSTSQGIMSTSKSPARPELLTGGAISSLNGFNTADLVKSTLALLHNQGVTHVDTARRYPPTSPGQSEQLLGEANVHSGSGFVVDKDSLSWQASAATRSARYTFMFQTIRRLLLEQVGDFVRVCDETGVPEIKPKVYQGE